MSQVKSAPTFISYFSLTHFNIILLPTPRNPTKLFLWRCNLLIYFMHVTCLAHLISHFISHSIKQRGHTVSLLNFMNPPSILNVPPPQTPHQRLSCPTPIQINRQNYNSKHDPFYTNTLVLDSYRRSHKKWKGIHLRGPTSVG